MKYINQFLIILLISFWGNIEMPFAVTDSCKYLWNDHFVFGTHD